MRDKGATQLVGADFAVTLFISLKAVLIVFGQLGAVEQAINTPLTSSSKAVMAKVLRTQQHN